MDSDAPVEERIGQALRERGELIAVAESCTGGLVGSLLTDVRGASDYFVGGVISYVNRTKRQRLAVSREAIERHGVVSQPVAREMARHVRDETGADWSVSTTGYADSGTEPDDADADGERTSDAPGGTVFVGIAAAGDEGEEPYALVEHHRFEGSRREMKAQIARQALESTLAQIRADEREGKGEGEG